MSVAETFVRALKLLVVNASAAVFVFVAAAVAHLLCDNDICHVKVSAAVRRHVFGLFIFLSVIPVPIAFALTKSLVSLLDVNENFYSSLAAVGFNRLATAKLGGQPKKKLVSRVD